MYLKDPHATLLQSTKHRDIQFITENIHQELKDATLGYALMTFLDENDLGSGPRMVTQSINPRAINSDIPRISSGLSLKKCYKTRRQRMQLSGEWRKGGWIPPPCSPCMRVLI